MAGFDPTIDLRHDPATGGPIQQVGSLPSTRITAIWYASRCNKCDDAIRYGGRGRWFNANRKRRCSKGGKHNPTEWAVPFKDGALRYDQRVQSSSLV